MFKFSEVVFFVSNIYKYVNSIKHSVLPRCPSSLKLPVGFESTYQEECYLVK